MAPRPLALAACCCIYCIILCGEKLAYAMGARQNTAGMLAALATRVAKAAKSLFGMPACIGRASVAPSYKRTDYAFALLYTSLSPST